MEGYDVAADITTMAKVWLSGFTVDVAAVTERADGCSSSSGLGGTYPGNPLGIAASHAVLDVIEDEDLYARRPPMCWVAVWKRP
jgi:4-aminobutyrate aminotransferase